MQARKQRPVIGHVRRGNMTNEEREALLNQQRQSQYDLEFLANEDPSLYKAVMDKQAAEPRPRFSGPPSMSEFGSLIGLDDTYQSGNYRRDVVDYFYPEQSYQRDNAQNIMGGGSRNLGIGPADLTLVGGPLDALGGWNYLKEMSQRNREAEATVRQTLVDEGYNPASTEFWKELQKRLPKKEGSGEALFDVAFGALEVGTAAKLSFKALGNFFKKFIPNAAETKAVGGLSAVEEPISAARSGAIDPREANNINIQLAKDAQEAMPAMPTLKAQDAANKLSKQFGVNFDVSNHPTAYGNSTYVSGRISGPGRTNVRVGFRLSDHETGDIRKATDDFLTIIDDGNVSAESLVAEVQSQIERALPKMQKISDDREAKTIAQSDALSRWSELSGDERGEIAVKFNETRPTRFNNVPWKNLTKQQKADFAVDGPLAKDAQEAYKDSFNIDAIHGQYDVGNSRGFQTYGPDTEKGGFGETPGEALNAFEGTDQKEDNFWTSDLGSWFADRSTGGNDVANYFAGADKTSADLARDNPEFGGAVYPVKLQMKNPFVFETHDDLEQAMAEFSEMVGDEYWKKELARVEDTGHVRRGDMEVAFYVQGGN
jgi:hypothetical protein